MHAKLFCCALISLLVISADGRTEQQAPQTIESADLVLVGGTIVDGTGSKQYVGDVAILGDRIVGIGVIEIENVKERIDCTGMVVSPGFIDLHNHSDAPILAPKTRSAENYLMQGCTTIVTGNCGGGDGEVALYYENIDREGAGVNVAHLLPQGELRGWVIGLAMREPTADELIEMRHKAKGAMLDGAWGMSTGLQYVPSAYAKLDELASIAEVIAEHGGIYASHIRDEGDNLLESVEEAIEIGRRSGAHVHVSHFKASKRRNWGRVRAAAKRIEAARDEGLAVTADQYPYNASSTSIRAMLLSDEEREGGEEAMIARLSSEEHGPRMRRLVEENLEARGPIMVASLKEHPTWVGKLLTEIAEQEQRALIDVAMEVLLTGGAAGVSFSMDEQDVRFVMTLPYVATASDGSSKIDNGTKPHPRSFGTFPRKVGHYSLREQIVPLETAIYSSTGLPAEILGMEDRGVLRTGMVADIFVFDPEALIDTATFQAPYGKPKGIERVIVNGQSVVVDGEFSGELAGRALRKPRSN